MTKEELIKEAEEQVNYCTPLYPECFIQGYVASAGLREKRIEELEKENVELKADNEARKFAMAMSEKVEKQLREENAELKDKNKALEQYADLADAKVDEVKSKLTKAREIIKSLLRLWNDVMTEESVKALIAEAEQFISEVEK